MKRSLGQGTAHLTIVLAVLIALVGTALTSPQTALAAKFNFSPKSGPPGTKVTVTVSGAPSGEDLTVTGNGNGLCSIKINNSGDGSCTFSAPKGSGNLTLTITGPNVGSADIGTFKITKDNNGGGGHGGNSHNGGGNNKGNGKNNGGGNGNGGDKSGNGNGIKRISEAVVGECGRAVSINTLQLLYDKGGAAKSVPGSIVSCRNYIPGNVPVGPDTEELLENLSCVGDLVTVIGAGGSLAALSTISVAAVGGPIVVGALGTQGILYCVPKIMHREFCQQAQALGARCDDLSEPIKNLGPLPSGPVALPSQNTNPTTKNVPAPAVTPAPLTPGEKAWLEQQGWREANAPDVPSFQDVMDNLNSK